MTFSVNGEVDDDLTRDDNTAMPTSATVPTACGDCWAFAGWSTNEDEDGAPAYAGGDTQPCMPFIGKALLPCIRPSQVVRPIR